ncbi:glycosyltransferase [Frigidibacter sp. MR17.14]|uniref:glycosyltransferase n=1 Tax=Frigidibacter sp. MR17.14 TaxID=3126509 RepID=UPI003012A742
MTADFAINGRFLSQGMTGVQRYASNVVEALHTAQPGSIAIHAPRQGALRLPEGLTVQRGGRFTGQLWEQLDLPRLQPGPLLNLCNTAPLRKENQVVCIHDANVFVAPESYGAAFRRAYQLMQPMIARRAMRVATVSEASARQLARHLPLRAAEIAVLPNGHEHALAWDPDRAEIAPAQIAPARPFILAIGSRARHKNLDLLTKIAPELDALGIDVVIAGGGGAIFAEESSGGPRLASNVRMLGRLSDDDLAWLMDRALCLAFPSWTEGFGLPLVEAMARGCAVVSSDRASMPEVCGAAGLLAAPDDPSAWVDHIAALAGSTQLRADLVGRGFEQVKRFSWGRSAAGYLELMQAGVAQTVPAPAPAAQPAGNMAVVVATRGRPAVVSATVRHLLATQTLKPRVVFISCTDPQDAGDLAALDEVVVLVGPPGSSAQRNTGIAAVPKGIDAVAFFDDDFVADPGWLAAAAQVFRDESSVTTLTGHVLADGIKGAGISFERACEIVATASREDGPAWIEPFSPYGCNMVFRASAIRDMAFDERLVLYGWLEDRDFGATLARRGGRMAKSGALRGVHMGVKSGRVAGERLGYSQVVNPVYMLRKRTMTARQVAGQIFRNMASNLVLAFRPEPFIDRRGRLRGNCMAVADLLRGRIEPERAAQIASARKTA